MLYYCFMSSNEKYQDILNFLIFSVNTRFTVITPALCVCNRTSSLTCQVSNVDEKTGINTFKLGTMMVHR